MKHCADRKQFSRLTQTDNSEPKHEVTILSLTTSCKTKFFIVHLILAKIICCQAFYFRNNAFFFFFKEHFPQSEDFTLDYELFKVGDRFFL